MRNPSFGLAVVLVTVLAASPASAQDAGAAAEPTKAQDIQRLLELTGAARIGELIMDQLLAAQKQAHPRVPEELWSELRVQLDPGKLAVLTGQIWDKHFTHDEIRGLISFHESPLGQKLLEKQPVIVQEAMALGQAWGQEAARKVLEKLQQKGYLKEA